MKILSHTILCATHIIGGSRSKALHGTWTQEVLSFLSTLTFILVDDSVLGSNNW